MLKTTGTPQTNLQNNGRHTRFIDFIRHPWLLAAVAVWVGAIIIVLILSPNSLPWGASTTGSQAGGNPTVGTLLNLQAQLLEQLALIALVFYLTRKRQVPDIAARAPVLSTSRAEVLGMVAYGLGAQALGYLLGKLLGGYPISFHLPGLTYAVGILTAGQLYVWVAYNFIVYAVVPYFFFRWRGYSNEALSLKSANLRADVSLILVVVMVESTAQLLLNHEIFNLPAPQLLIGVPVTFLLYFFGTCLPTMVFVYAILVPRYLRLTGSTVATVILGGITYAGMHIFDAWGVFDTPTNGLLTLIFVFFQYFGPGMVKAALTVRTGNAWTHLWAYHAIAPHVWFDTPLIVYVLHIL